MTLTLRRGGFGPRASGAKMAEKEENRAKLKRLQNAIGKRLVAFRRSETGENELKQIVSDLRGTLDELDPQERSSRSNRSGRDRKERGGFDRSEE